MSVKSSWPESVFAVDKARKAWIDATVELSKLVAKRKYSAKQYRDAKKKEALASKKLSDAINIELNLRRIAGVKLVVRTPPKRPGGDA